MIHEKVRSIRESKGITKTHVAKKLGMTLPGYAHIENGDVRLDVERLKVIAEILGEKPCIFFTE